MTTNHSKAAMEWLLWQEHCLGQAEWGGLTEDAREQYEMVALTYPDTLGSHHPLFRQRMHPTWSESRRTPSRRDTLHCGRVRRTDQHGIRVRGVFLARVPHMLPSTRGGVPPSDGSNHGGCEDCGRPKAGSLDSSGVPRGDDLGVSMERPQTVRPRRA